MMDENDIEKVDKKAEQRKLVGIGLICLILILYVISLFTKIYNRESDKQERVEQIINKLQDEYNK